MNRKSAQAGLSLGQHMHCNCWLLDQSLTWRLCIGERRTDRAQNHLLPVWGRPPKWTCQAHRAGAGSSCGSVWNVLEGWSWELPEKLTLDYNLPPAAREAPNITMVCKLPNYEWRFSVTRLISAFFSTFFAKLKEFLLNSSKILYLYSGFRKIFGDHREAQTFSVSFN